ncbi:hypothetical protein [Gemmata sp.]|uniref:hypothetical protein n=1 Tax=Gemmata sp. TaxID=1914242 RepID=UPI003F7282C8
MPNDAKLGMLVGVVGVVFVAVMSARPVPHAPAAANVPAPVQKSAAHRATDKLVAPAPPDRPVVNLLAEAKPTPSPEPHLAPAVLPTELPSTPVVRTSREPVATPTGRSRTDPDLEP